MKRLFLNLGIILFLIFAASCSKKDNIIDNPVSETTYVILKVNDEYANASRTKFLHKVLKDAYPFYKSLYPTYNFPILTLQLSTESEWGTNLGGPPYGVPNYDEENCIIQIGVTKDAAANSMGYPIPETDESLAEIDKIMIHEMGHYFFHNVVSAPEDEAFAWEFMATYFAINYLNENHGGWNMNVVKESKPEDINYRTVDDFNTMVIGVGVENYDWFQRRFLTLAKNLHTLKGKGLVDDFISMYVVEKSNLPFIDFLKQQDKTIVESWLETLATSL